MLLMGYAALSVILGVVCAQSADEGSAKLMSPCAATCINNVFSAADRLGCQPGDTLCICKKTPEFENGINDCVMQACVLPLGEPIEQVAHAADHGADLCNEAYYSMGVLPYLDPPSESPTSRSTKPAMTAAEVAGPTAAGAPVPAATSLGPSTTAASPATESAVTTTSVSTEPAPDATGQSKSPESAPPDPTETVESATSHPPSASTTALTREPSAEVAGMATPGAEPPPAKSTESAPPPGGLPVEVKAGISAGACVAAVMGIIVAVYLILRRKKEQRGSDIKISGPLPGAGRQWAPETKTLDNTFPTAYTSSGRSPQTSDSNDAPGRNSYSSELDRQARRYEDMLPRAQPRMMI
ncbi:hypothetical protein DL766_002423 [Monosporascus sp. MC13-8B]|uniref:CFEM domain-containing protein n=1 Tax=Monosporascus cannonballus TaxID=155416 RepID=A0ABY0H2C6_9PEZI|nr:hypothetical protein DL762_006324 [Monosporascus cannonballus]RYO90711.1 hypothetical protein DL763_005250 [Monosporascus cannonballus]RYP35566.1 hypothetical protein DL766_002423 [Monosporascus sp. MC13-8B]